MDQPKQPFECQPPIQKVFFTAVHSERFQAVIQRHRTWSVALRPKHLGSGRVVSDSINPRSQGTPAIKPRKTSPERYMDFLQQVATPIRIAFVSACKPLNRGTERCDCLGITLILTCGPAHFIHSAEGSRRAGEFLTLMGGSRREGEFPRPSNSPGFSEGLPRRVRARLRVWATRLCHRDRTPAASASAAW